MSNSTLYAVLRKSRKHHLDVFGIALISCIHVSQHPQDQTMCVDTCPLMYTQQIR